MPNSSLPREPSLPNMGKPVRGATRTASQAIPGATSPQTTFYSTKNARSTVSTQLVDKVRNFLRAIKQDKGWEDLYTVIAQGARNGQAWQNPDVRGILDQSQHDELRPMLESRNREAIETVLYEITGYGNPNPHHAEHAAALYSGPSTEGSRTFTSSSNQQSGSSSSQGVFNFSSPGAGG